MKKSLLRIGTATLAGAILIALTSCEDKEKKDSSGSENASGSPSSAVDKMLDFAKKPKLSNFKALAPDDTYDYFIEKNYDGDEADFVDDYEDSIKKYEASERFDTTKLEIIDEEELDDSDFDNLKSILKDDYNIMKKDVDEAKTITVKVTYEDEDGDDKSDKEEMIAVKVNGTWYIKDSLKAVKKAMRNN